MERRSLRDLSDHELLRRLALLLGQSRRAEADLVAHIAEVDARKLYAREASSSMFAYCTDVLHLSEAEAYLRIAAGRASLEHPLLLEMLAEGRLHLSGIAKLAPHLTPENASVLLARAAHKTKRQVLELVAEVAPRADVPAVVRKLPERQHLTPGKACLVAPSEPRSQARADSEGPARGTAPGYELGPGQQLRPRQLGPSQEVGPNRETPADLELRPDQVVGLDRELRLDQLLRPDREREKKSP